MTIEDKRDMLQDYCNDRESCADCPFEFFNKDCNFMFFSAENIEKAYNLIYDSTISIFEYNKKLNNENAELKRLLKLAVEDIYEICDVPCQNFECCDYCTRDGDNDCYHCFNWKHADEAMKLIGGN